MNFPAPTRDKPARFDLNRAPRVSMSHVTILRHGFWLLLCLAPLAGHARQAQSSAAGPASSASSQPQELDKVIAIVNGDVLLQSDVQEELQFDAIQPLGASGEVRDMAAAGKRLINRILILQQMKAQQTESPVSDADLQKGLADLHHQIPACVRFHCDTPEGWKAFLQQNNLAGQQVLDRVRQRLQIVAFIDERFRNGIRISQPEIQAYYDKTFVPAFQKERAKPPALSTVSSRIEEILLQQRVNGLFQDWLKSLREQGSVQILDPAYGTSSTANDDNGGAA